MTFKFKPHIPNFIDCDRPPATTYNTVDELFASERILKWSQKEDFDFWAKSPMYKSTAFALMAMMKDGKYWVVGNIDPPDVINHLPNWKETWQYLSKEPERQAEKEKRDEESRKYIEELRNSFPPARKGDDEIAQGFASMVNNLRGLANTPR